MSSLFLICSITWMIFFASQPLRSWPTNMPSFSYVRSIISESAAEKVEGPLPVLCFLGIELDCQQLEARLPEPKLQGLQSLVTRYSTYQTITQRQLESFLGKLSFAVRVITPGRTFMRRLWDTCRRNPKLHYRIHLSEEALSDIKWWHCLRLW